MNAGQFMDAEAAASFNADQDREELTRESDAGVDPLNTDVDGHRIRQQAFEAYLSADNSLADIFGALVNGNMQPFHSAILKFMQLSNMVI